MSDEQLESFLEKVKDDSSLQDKLKAAGDPEAVVAIAKEAGFVISVDDLKNAQSELSDEEMESFIESVAGGACVFTTYTRTPCAPKGTDGYLYISC